jgi:hypothetical protein
VEEIGLRMALGAQTENVLQTAFLTFAMARASRSHISSSTLSCLLPALVSV